MVAGSVTTFSRLWEGSVEADPARRFLTFEAPDGSLGHWTYGEFDDHVADIAAAFSDAGVGPDRGVHLALTNTPAFVAAWLAALRLGSYIVPSDPMATAPELAEHIARTSPAVGLCAISRSSAYRQAVTSGAGNDLRVIEVDESLPVVGIAGGSPRPAVDGERQASPLDRAAVMFTSGTTGRPKGVVITQANYAFAGQTMAVAAGLSPDDRQLVVLPLFHANAQYYSFASAIAVGASVALMHTFSASGFIEQAARHGATHASLFAGPMRMILARGGPLVASADGPPLRLRHCWFAQNLGADQYEVLADWLGCRPRQLYGMTETIPAVLTDDANAPRCDTMGYVTDGCRVDIHDADGRPCGSDVVGELVVAGRPGVELFAEYLDDPGTTAVSFRGDWFLTGDRASRDAGGRFRFAGRRADLLKVSGENVSVVEVEAVLGAHPDVLDVVVVGAPDPIRDEVPVAFVVPRVATLAADHDSTRLASDLEQWALERLAKAKRPNRYVVVSDLPRTSVGKIRKFMLADAAAAHTPHPSTTATEVPT